MGELHLEVAVEKIRQAHGLDVDVGRPQVAYRETVVRGVTGLRLPARQAGRRRRAVRARRPRRRTAGRTASFVFRSTVVGGRVPQEYVRAVEAGCRDALADGPLGGHPVIGLRVTLTDGATHSKDSSELAFRTAGRLGAARGAAGRARWSLLEPVVEVTVTVPEDAVGGVLGDLAARRGRVTGLDGPRPGRWCHRDRAAGRAVRLRDAAAQPDPGPGHVHHPAGRLPAGTGADDHRVSEPPGVVPVTGDTPGGADMRPATVCGPSRSTAITPGGGSRSNSGADPQP